MKIFLILICIFTFSYSNKVGMWVLMLWLNDDNYKPWEEYVRYTPEYGTFNSLDEKRISHIIKKAEELKVDYLILDNTNGIYRHQGRFEDTIVLYFKKIKEMKSNIKIVIAIGHSIYHHKNFELLRSNIHHFKYTHFKNEAYYHINNKPLLILYINPEDNIANVTKDNTNLKYITNNDKYGYKTYFNDISLKYASGADSWIDDEDGIYG